MEINRDLLVITLAFNAADSPDTEFDMTNLQADTLTFLGIRDNPHFIVIDKRILGRKVRFGLVEE